MKAILEGSKSDLLTKCRDEHNNTPLHMASSKGHLDVVKYLVEEKKCNLQEVNKDHNNSLHVAALNGQPEILQYMMNERGSDPMCKGENGSNTALGLQVWLPGNG